MKKECRFEIGYHLLVVYKSLNMRYFTRLCQFTWRVVNSSMEDGDLFFVQVRNPALGRISCIQFSMSPNGATPITMASFGTQFSDP